MFANSAPIQVSVGTLHGNVPRPASFRFALFEFVAGALPGWRDRADRPSANAETVLTSQLCAHLNSLARHTRGWDILQFRVEEPDETKKGRKIDLIAAPIGATITIEGRKYLDFDSLMPIECKRLPTPQDSSRDPREYVFCSNSSTGGIQRFKEGNHGAQHGFGAMIGYVQKTKIEDIQAAVLQWIAELADTEEGWSEKDLLDPGKHDTLLRLATYSSSHSRKSGLPDIQLYHAWIEL